MLFDNLYDDNDKEAYTSYSEAYYNSRSHQDGERQFCDFCNAEREFLWDRCTVCHNN